MNELYFSQNDVTFGCVISKMYMRYTSNNKQKARAEHLLCQKKLKIENLDDFWWKCEMSSSYNKVIRLDSNCVKFFVCHGNNNNCLHIFSFVSVFFICP